MIMIMTVTFPPLSELPNIGPPQTSPVNLELGPGRWSSFSYIMFFVLKTLICSALISASERIRFHIPPFALCSPQHPSGHGSLTPNSELSNR